jgi:hypothetical protein
VRECARTLLSMTEQGCRSGGRESVCMCACEWGYLPLKRKREGGQQQRPRDIPATLKCRGHQAAMLLCRLQQQGRLAGCVRLCVVCAAVCACVCVGACSKEVYAGNSLTS